MPINPNALITETMPSDTAKSFLLEAPEIRVEKKGITQPTTVRLNDGNLMPLVGLGTLEAPAGQVEAAVTAAIKAGYRHIDCADFYGNEHEVGQALSAAFDSGLVRRKDLFVTTKVWPTWYSAGRPTLSLQRSLKNLQLDYVDLLLIHWPTPFQQGDNYSPKDENGKLVADDSIDLVEVWREFEQLKKAGMTNSIGVSNFNARQLQKLVEAGPTPAVNQVESHPFLAQNQLLSYCKSRNIVLEAYSPLARTGTEAAKKKNVPSPLTNELINEIATRYGKTAAQVVLRWQVQRGVVVIPKSVTPTRIAANKDIFDFELNENEMEALSNLDLGLRTATMSLATHHKNWPFGDKF